MGYAMRMCARTFASVSFFLCFLLIIASLAGLPGCSSSSSGGGGGPQPISVTIANKITTIAAGAAAVTLNASVKNDSTNSGVTWALVTGGNACSPACGSLSGATSTSITYTPPATLPAAPNNAPTITATSVKDTSKSDSDGFTITAPAISVTITNKITSVVAGSTAITFQATVHNDSANKGVTWALNEPNGSPCPTGCGALSGNTSTSVTYTPPSSDFGPPFDTPVLVATSVSDTTKSDSDSFTVVALTVTITNKIKSIKTGSPAVTLHAVVQNDPTNSGVLWSLSDTSGQCSPACGTLTNTTTTSAVYTPPATVPAAPANTPDINASSVHGSAFDDDTFDIISTTVSSCAGSPTGHESRLSGHYAFFAEGSSGVGSSIAGSFAPDGTGKITDLGGGVGGEVDFNNGLNPIHATVVPSGSLYTVGVDPTGAGDLGCLQTLTSDGTTTIYRFSLNGAAGGAVATKGRIIEFDDQSGNNTGFRMSGALLKQDPTAFSSGDTSHLQANYAFGVSGIGAGSGVAAGGSFVLTPSTGVISSMTFDEDLSGTNLGQTTGATGTITGVSAKTGRALLSILSTSTFAPTGLGVYIVNANELFLASLEPAQPGIPSGAPGVRYAGRAIVSMATSSSTQLNGNFIFHLSATPGCTGSSCGAIALGVVTLTSTNSTSGTSSGTLEGYDVTQGPVSLPLNGTYSITPGTGRVTLSASFNVSLPVLYLAAPVASTEDITAFIIGTDPTGIFGLIEPGASSAVTTSSLAGNYFFGDEQPRDGTVVNRVGVVAIASSGAATGTEDDSATAGVSTNAVSYTVTIDNSSGDDTGNVGANSFAVTNGTKLFFFEEGTSASRPPASITVVEKQ
jgi:hypothetical protein